MSEPIDVARFGTPLTPAERAAVSAYNRLGSVKQVAAELKKSPSTIAHQLGAARVRTGAPRSFLIREPDAA